MHRRKGGEQHQAAHGPASGIDGGSATPKEQDEAADTSPAHAKSAGPAAKAAKAAAGAATGRGSKPHQQQEEQQPEQQQASWQAGEPALLLELAAAIAALLLLLACHRAAVRVLAPQTGDWLASSFCSLALFALAAVGTAAGHVAEHGRVVLAAARANASTGVSAEAELPSTPASSGIPPPGQSVVVYAWWTAAAAAMALAAPAGGPLASLAGRLLLAPGLADDGTLRISDAEVTLRAMGLAAVLAGPLFLAVGCAAGAAGGRVLRRWAGTSSRPLLLLLPLLAGTAALALGVGLPAALVPPHPAASLPPAIASVAAAMAAGLMQAPSSAAATGAATRGKKKKRTQHSQQRGSSHQQQQRLLAAALAVAALALAAQRALTPCSLAVQPEGAAVQLEGGRYAVLAQCEVAGGGRLGVVEGTYKGQYRYRLLRMDHSVLGGEYVAPADVAGQSIYTAFYLQQAALLFNPNGTRSLHVGLGIGTAVKGMQRVGVAGDSLELLPEVLAAAQRFFGLQPGLNGGEARVGDALAVVPQLGRTDSKYDYILHDVFSGGGTAAPLMDVPFFRQLSALLVPAGGVLAVNYYGGKGQGLKEVWCRLRLVFDSVRAFADVEKSRVRNHVLFASNANLAAANLTAAVLAASARQAAAEAEGRGEVFDPLQLRLWRALGRQEVQLTYDRQRCLTMLRRHGMPGGWAGREGAAAQQGRQQQQEEEEKGGGSGQGAWKQWQQAQRQGQGAGPRRGKQQQQGQQTPPWIWRQLKSLRERHALAVTHWVAMRSQFADSLWLS